MQLFALILFSAALASCDFIKSFMGGEKSPPKEPAAASSSSSSSSSAPSPGSSPSSSSSAAQKPGQAFLEQNKKKSGVKALPSGLQYKILKEGSGQRPGASSQVTVHYRGTLIDGTEFDSSYKRGQSASFPLNQVIRGWTEGLQLMRPGAVYQFFIPPELGYGSRDMPQIPAHSVLIFKVELISVQ